ncbi:U3 small nucleolar RNA-associated protein 18 homolog, partial [Orbicella faveolata]|uniref:U3 small nucleolar RNA-associated protein 18 homolog n=1 Tax=Orbicella faveolata TaxID=48498 RepID=UPI0009E437CB
MLRRKQKRQIGQPKFEETSSKISKKDSASENSDGEDERTLERLVFGGENDAIRELEKDFTEDQDRFYSSSYHPVYRIPPQCQGSSHCRLQQNIRSLPGREERYFDKFHVSPDGKHLVFVGTNGYLILLSSKTKQWIGNLKMNSSVSAVTFNADGSRMFTAGGDGEVYVWDMNTRRCVHKFRDEGCLKSTTLSASRDGQYIACGSDSGVVNVYDNQCLHQTQPKPLKAIMNLTTSVHKTLFNSTSEILAISSRARKDLFKMLHLPSLTVFSNWPTSRTPLRYVNAFDFSPNSGYLSIGND